METPMMHRKDSTISPRMTSARILAALEGQPGLVMAQVATAADALWIRQQATRLRALQSLATEILRTNEAPIEDAGVLARLVTHVWHRSGKRLNEEETRVLHELCTAALARAVEEGATAQSSSPTDPRKADAFSPLASSSCAPAVHAVPRLTFDEAQDLDDPEGRAQWQARRDEEAHYARLHHIESARAAWPYGPDDFDALRHERQREREDREFALLSPRERADAIRAHNDAIESGRD